MASRAVGMANHWRTARETRATFLAREALSKVFIQRFCFLIGRQYIIFEAEENIGQVVGNNNNVVPAMKLFRIRGTSAAAV